LIDPASASASHRLPQTAYLLTHARHVQNRKLLLVLVLVLVLAIR